MGTRCLTVIQDDAKEVVCLYRQFDGYPAGHGAELLTAFKGFRITNDMISDRARTANGMGCLAAQLVAAFKTEPGGFYLYAPGTRDIGEEFVYTLSAKGARVWLDVSGCGLPLYSGLLDAFDPARTNEDAAAVPNDNGDEIRHDVHGYYICTALEAAHEDAGNPSVGFDGRPHFATLAEALASMKAEA